MDPSPTKVHRSTIFRGIDLHHSDTVLIVRFVIQAAAQPPVRPGVADQEESKKIVLLTNLSAATDTADLAAEVLEQCKIIPPEQSSIVEQLICRLKFRLGFPPTYKGRPLSPDGSSDFSRGATSATALSPLNQGSGIEDAHPIVFGVTEPEPSMENLDNYLELMYEGTSSKIRGTAIMFELARNPENLRVLSQNG
ncbi:kinesin-associated protein 3-like [Ischnura elegans]|uniref:kinesin-associated protein 3-like n=1 Tax=Ischnura elegans TaxID=197161 RepID=UPI001ED8A061|nr:kinesin-associated protein 3-like [Ischnura elegans]